MTDVIFQEGDEVSWKWGTSEPTGIIAEVRNSGQLEIESKGKLVHKNADPSNPAVHVERSGNDVVKRASELKKLNPVEGESTEASISQNKTEAPATQETADQDAAGEAKEKEANDKAAPKKGRGRRKSSAASATTGEKRVAEEVFQDDTDEAAEKKTKKTKTTRDVEASGEKKGPGRPRKGSKAKKPEEGHKTAEGGDERDVDTSMRHEEGSTLAKKKGRPKKSDASDHAPAEHTLVREDAPAAHTRSKD
ncbi:hypothetical protein H0H92_008385 [Tricholoma furcatifolium]|nr:hypothetical protein H0H92_008385 [Tricholoma furcatifolium]